MLVERLAALFLAAAAPSQPAAGAPGDQHPPVPPLDTAVVEASDPVGAARRALGPAANRFAEARPYRLHPMYPDRVAIVDFYERPRAIHPGLCAVRILSVRMKRLQGSRGGEALGPERANWRQRYRVVDAALLGVSGPGADDTKAACEALSSAAFVSDMPVSQGFDAPSEASAIAHAVAFQSAVAHAAKGGRLPFDLTCEDFTRRACGKARSRLARLSATGLRSTATCTRPAGQDDCYAVLVESVSLRRHGDAEVHWLLEIVTPSGQPDRPRRVGMEFTLPPLI